MFSGVFCFPEIITDKKGGTKMKRFISFILYITMTLMLCISVSADALTRIYYPDGTQRLVGKSLVYLETMKGATLAPKKEKTVLMYAEDGRTLDVKESEIQLYENVGWFLGPVTLMYAPEDRTLTVRNSEVELYESLGWFTEPVVTMYAADGRTLAVKNTEIELYKTVGWYAVPVMTVFAEDGRTLVIAKDELEAYKNVGWYESPKDFPKRNRPMVALTFDDGPGQHTGRILDCLEKHGAKATFFVIGKSVNTYPSVVKRAYDMGMEIGNHTMTHPRLTNLSTSGIKSELDKTSSAIYSATGAYPTLIRPPYGSYNSTVSLASNAPLILWSIDTLDWKTRNADKTVESVLNNVKDGSVILMHDIHAPTADAVVRIVPELINRGYSLVTVSELAEAKGYSMQNGKAYNSFYKK